ncbi:MAG TPA: RagB/SusD family nutrient uptake outer membrane protein [Flavisolibacter sp.]|nr:RagB/SusD family nutrient uptake outer membrane protein [Flavisolibacter sp.]
MRLTFYKSVLVFVVMLAVSCSKLTDVNNLKPVNQLSEDEAITTVGKAQSVLYGTYGLVKSGLEIVAYTPGLTALRGLTMEPGSFAGASEASYQSNEVASDDYYLDAIYTKFYKVISNANQIIDKAPLIETNDPRRDEIVAEAKFIRALSHFYLLRMYGYFFDLSSPYGIVIKDKPVKGAISEARAPVTATYDFILADLDYAIAHGPSFGQSFYASREAAMALAAKVNLYKKDYAKAATLAQQVIGSGKFQLETRYSDIFLKKIINTKEVIFQTPYDDKNDRNNKAFIFRAYYLPSAYYANLLAGDNRDTAALVRNTNGTLRNKKFNNTVFNGQSLTADTEYFLRLDEIYLILAEALVRSGGSLTDAADALDAIRSRVQMPNTTATTAAELLEAIRIEKILELGAEDGEEWYDLVRYASENDLNVATYKPGVTSEKKYVLPLPYETVKLSNNVVVQNPGY